jgi:uncharacterized protein (TIGR03435 family)
MTRLALLLAGLAVLVLPLAAQQPPLPPRFEVASVKPSVADARAPDNTEVQPSGRVIITNSRLDLLVRGVFELERQELVVGERVPGWFASDRWDIVAQGPPLTDAASQRQIRTMMQNLLIDRFKLVTRRETRNTPTYALVVARSDGHLGPQLKPSTADCAAMAAAFKATGARQGPDSPVCGVKPIRGQFRGTGIRLSDLARALAVSGRPVVDATGLTGSFDFELKWIDDGAGAGAGDSLFTTIQEQLGLRLEPRQTPTTVLVIDSVERPTPD